MDERFAQESVRAPEFGPGGWLNTPQPLTMAGLRGRPTLIYFWDYTSVHCLRALPYLRHWHERYAGFGLTVVGVHTPAFSFGREREQVRRALDELDVRYPVLLDNDYRTWNAFNNRFWPAVYLIDQHGAIRFQGHGEGGYGACEQAVQTVVREIDSSADLPPLLPALRDEDRPDVVWRRPTPELRGGFDQGGLGNPEGYAGNLPILYRLPRARRPGAFYVAGAWQAGREYLAYQGQTEGIVRLPYEATEVYAVLSPHPEVVERMLHPEPVSVEVYQDDRPLDEARRGRDVAAEGRVVLERPRAYHLVRNPGFEQHELTLRVHARGVAVYTFAFVGGVAGA